MPEREARTFYGGEVASGAQRGELGVGRYEGRGLGEFGAWKCPKCGVENTTPFEQGCPSCGGGAPGQHVGIDYGKPAPAVKPAVFPSPGVDVVLRDAAEAWVAQRPGVSAVEAFLAGYLMARQQAAAHVMQAPPVTADIEQLAPEGKVRRTIIAALKLFKDQILSDTPEEIATGEWCAVEEVDALLATLEVERD